MMDYRNRTNTSCVYDAFERAGLPTTDDMLLGVTFDCLVSLLEGNGYKVYRNGKRVKIPSNQGFFVVRTPVLNEGHIEYHASPEGVFDYPPESICAIAIRAK